MPAGRPSSYDPAILGDVQAWAEGGATDIEIADLLEITPRTLYRWKAQHEEFRQALKAGKEVADARVERSLYERATGFRYVEQKPIKLRDPDGAERVEVVDVECAMPPDTTAAIFWLKNRKPTEWRDRTETEHSGNVTVSGIQVSFERPGS